MKRIAGFAAALALISSLGAGAFFPSMASAASGWAQWCATHNNFGLNTTGACVSLFESNQNTSAAIVSACQTFFTTFDNVGDCVKYFNHNFLTHP